MSVNKGGNKATIASTKTVEQPVAVSIYEGGNEATIAITKTLEKPVAMSINKGATVTTGTSVEASAHITTTANPSTDS